MATEARGEKGRTTVSETNTQEKVSPRVGACCRALTDYWVRSTEILQCGNDAIQLQVHLRHVLESPQQRPMVPNEHLCADSPGILRKRETRVYGAQRHSWDCRGKIRS